MRASAIIRFALPSPAPVDLAVFDVQGRWVASLLNGEARPAGWHEVPLRAESWLGGFYFLRLQASSTKAVQKFVLLR